MKELKAVLAILVMGLMALLPLRLSQALGRFIGRRQYAQGGKSYGITRRNIELCLPELDQGAREAMVRESLQQTGCAIAEMGMSWLWPPSSVLKRIRTVHGEELIREQLDAGKGILLIAPHLGNWEVMNLYLSQHYPVTAMYKPPKLELMDRLIRKMRARLGSNMAPADAKGVRMVLKALRRGEIVGILPDQEPDRSGGIFAPFFGTQALTMKLFPQLAAQTKTTVVCGYARRLPDAQGFDLYFSLALPEVNSRDIDSAAAAMNASIERCVREVPEQYQWEYKRFNTRPEGEVSPYLKLPERSR